MNDTIAAISTPFGEGAIAVLRLSGPQAMVLAETVFRGSKMVNEMRPRVQYYGGIFDTDRKLDEVLLTVFRAPHSYTGEDVVEIAGHGGVLVSRKILEVLLQAGARSAEPGEFTQRAYLHGKMDLTQAEAVMDLIRAQTDLALHAATEQLEGRLGERIRGLREAVIELLAHVEAYIDFPDEDIDPATGIALLEKLNAVGTETDALLATADRGKVLREGVRTVIYGAPNVGKSSLLNLLLGHDRAIVSSRPGTTRDVIEEVINLRGLPLRLIDTAGVRESDDEIERAGIERTRAQVQRADLVLHVLDASEPPEATDFTAESAKRRERTDEGLGGNGNASSQPLRPCASSALSAVGPSPALVRVLNKSDLGEHESWRGVEGVRISCRQGSGIEKLAEAIVARVSGGGAAHRDWSLAINARHADCLRRVRGFADAARGALTSGLSPEFVAEELRGALDAVGEIVGKADSDEILGKIFSTFCIGK